MMTNEEELALQLYLEAFACGAMKEHEGNRAVGFTPDDRGEAAGRIAYTA